MLPADRLKAARRSRGYKTAQEFAIKYKIPIPTYSAHESGRNPLKQKVAEHYSHLLNISCEWLLYGKSASDQFIVDDSNSLRETWDAYRNSLEEETTLLVEIFNYIAELLGEPKIKKRILKIAIQINHEVAAQIKAKKGEAKLSPTMITYINRRLKDLGVLKINE